MKRLISLFLILAMALSMLVGCGGTELPAVSQPPAVDSTGTFKVPQRLMLADGREVYTRLYSMFVSQAEDKVIAEEAASLQGLLTGVEPATAPVGGTGYEGTIYTTGDYVVTTDDELKAALKKAESGQVVFIPSGVTIDLSDLFFTENFQITLRDGVILASDRGVGEGGVLRFSHPSGVMILCGRNSVVTGLNICGTVGAYRGNVADRKDIGFRLMGQNVTISNCEIASFNSSAILGSAKGSGTVSQCYIHHCETGIEDNKSQIAVEGNAFFGNETDLIQNKNVAALPEGNAVLAASAPADLAVERVQPDITSAIFPADSYEVYTLLGEVAGGDRSKLVDALAVHSGTTQYYRFRDQLSITKDGKVYGITDDGSPLGGGAGYGDIFTSGDFTATTLEELKTALENAKAGQTVFVPSNVQIDLTGTTITVPEGVILASDRGTKQADGSISSGAMLFTTTRQKETLILAANARLTGITLSGADTQRHMEHLQRGLSDDGGHYTDYYYKLPLTRGVSILGDGAEVDNCEIAGFSEAGVYIGGCVDVLVHHSWIHHNQRNGYGYGVVLYQQTYVEVYRNLFNFDRHAIAADGSAGSGYHAHDNAHLGTAIYHIFDAHGGKDRGDGTQIACERIDMNNNVFLSDKIPYKKRGIPQEYSKFTRNIIIYPEMRYPYRSLYGENFICEDNIWGICTDLPVYDFEGGKTFTIKVGGNIRLYEGLASIDSRGYSLRYSYFLVFTPTDSGYYISEYGNNLDDGSIDGVNETVKIPDGGFVLCFPNDDYAAKNLYTAIANRYGVIYNTSVGLDGDFIATRDGNTLTVIQGK